MHFFYLDESGCTGKNLKSTEQPIFVSGGIVVRDEGWNRTHEEFEKIINKYFGETVPLNFELHTKDLLSPEGKGFFKDHNMSRRNILIKELLDLIAERKHHIFFFAIDKIKLDEFDVSSMKTKGYFDLKNPYSIAYDYLIGVVNTYVKEKLGSSARALLVLDQKEELKNEVRSITEYRRYKGLKKNAIKWIAEYSYSVDSQKNTMIQLSDFVVHLIKRFLEVDKGYKKNWNKELKNIYRDFYKKINERLIRKTLLEDESRGSEEYNNFIKYVSISPSKGRKNTIYI